MSKWREKSLVELASFQKGRKVETNEHPREGFEPYLGATALAGGANEFGDARFGIRAQPGEVLMLWDGERSGLVGKGRAGVLSSTVAKFAPRGEVSGEFLYYVLDSCFAWIQNRRTGTGVPHVPRDLGRILRIAYPEDKDEQKRITEILETVGEEIEATEALIAKQQLVKAGLMHDLFTRGLTPEGKLRSPQSDAPALYHKTPLGWLPKEWSWASIGSLLAKTFSPMRSGPFGSALLKEELVETGIPLLGIDNVFVEHFEPTFRRFVSPRKFAELARYSVFSGDVIITIMGTVGRCCVVPDTIDQALSSKHLWTMTFDREQVIPELICWQLNHALWVKRWFARHSQGAVMEAIQSSTLRELTLPVPPVDEQKMMAQRYGVANVALAAESARLAKLRQQKQGLMQVLLTPPA